MPDASSSEIEVEIPVFTNSPVLLPTRISPVLTSENPVPPCEVVKVPEVISSAFIAERVITTFP